MAIYPKVARFKIGPFKIGTRKKTRITDFPFIIAVKERHYIGPGKYSNPVFQEHERVLQIVSEYEVYVTKKDTGECYFCKNFGGYLNGENINKDPYISKVLVWIP